MKTVLFVCTGNTCRSPMAEAIFRKICEERKLPFSPCSAGLFTRSGLPASQNSQEALLELGIDSKDFRSTSITDVDTDSVDFIVAMTPEHREVLESIFMVDKGKTLVLCEESGGVSDPYGGSLARYLQCRDEIKRGLETLIERLEKDEN